MKPIRDNLGAHFRMVEHKFRHTPLLGCAHAFAYRIVAAHGVPEVIDMAHAHGIYRGHFRPACIRVTAGNQASRGLGRPAEFDRSRKFRGARGGFDDAAGQGWFVFERVGIALKPLGMGAHLLLGEVRSVPVSTRDPRAVVDAPRAAHLLHRVQHGAQLRGRSRGGGRENRGCAVAGVGAVGNAYRLRRAIHVVATSAAMSMDVHKPRTDVAIARVDDFNACRQIQVARRPDRDKPFVFDNDHALIQQVFRQHHRAAKGKTTGHGVLAKFRCYPTSSGNSM